MLSGNPSSFLEPERGDADGPAAAFGSNDEDPSKLLTVPTATGGVRHKCPACFKQYKKKEHLVEHINTSYHSVHDPKCGVCQKHCKSFESLREHIIGPLSKASCSTIFAERGCSLCLKVFDCSDSLSQHRDICCLPAPAPLGTVGVPFTEIEFDNSSLSDVDGYGSGREAVAMDCAIVGGGSDGSLDLCARVCLVNEDEKIIFHSYVVPEISITDYRNEITGIKEEHIRDALPLVEVREKILEILHNGESIWKVRMGGGRAKVLVGHNLTRFLQCLGMYYPDDLLRDTAKYQPLAKTNFFSHTFKYLTKTYLGYTIHEGVHDTYQDSVTAMRLYKRMRFQDHHPDQNVNLVAPQDSMVFSLFNSKQLESMTPSELLEISKANYQCWCLDSRRK
ncbi:unnamed protein product [Cuscuta epithymum]|uniref:C2H2-type domain-containing protein n=1 Tax=Cuscuta epithymum TaxID=186058 RepID=A0AAV0FAX0_9ASTE|nr:unnamed protein product [Cuscuta epithymum]